jgi:hypothetical protein
MQEPFFLNKSTTDIVYHKKIFAYVIAVLEENI